jgi:hypothetical protein
MAAMQGLTAPSLVSIVWISFISAKFARQPHA